MLAMPAQSVSAFSQRVFSEGECQNDVAIASSAVEWVDPLTDPSWDESIAEHPEATVFHRSSWARVLHESYGHTPCYLRVLDQGKRVALVPLMEVKSLITGCRGVSLPFSDFSPVLLFENCRPSAVLQQLKRIAKERSWKYIELRGNSMVEASATPSVSFHGHTLSLIPDENVLYSGFASSVKRALRKANRSDLKIEITQSREAVEKYYQLHVANRRRQGLPPQPKAFF